MLRKLIRKGTLLQRVPYSHTQIWRLEKKGEFPRRVQLGPGAVAWFEDEIDAWIADRLRGLGKRPPSKGVVHLADDAA